MLRGLARSPPASCSLGQRASSVAGNAAHRAHQRRFANALYTENWKPQRFEAPVGNGKLKVVWENRNVYEGSFVRVKHVVYDPHGSGAGSGNTGLPAPQRATGAQPSWMRSPGGAVQRGLLGRRRR